MVWFTDSWSVVIWSRVASRLATNGTPSAHCTKLVLLVSVGSMQVKALNASSVSVSMIMLYWFQLSLPMIPCTSFVVVQHEIVLILYHIVPGFRYVRRTSSSDDSGITIFVSLSFLQLIGRWMCYLFVCPEVLRYRNARSSHSDLICLCQHNVWHDGLLPSKIFRIVINDIDDRNRIDHYLVEVK